MSEPPRPTNDVAAADAVSAGPAVAAVPTPTAPQPSRSGKAAPTGTKRSESPATNPHGVDPRLRRVLRLPVTASVRLAERKMELGQLLSLAPGALITFSKPHDEPLELYVNNRLYCRGEAVKAGEKYAIRLSEVTRTGSGS